MSDHITRSEVRKQGCGVTVGNSAINFDLLTSKTRSGGCRGSLPRSFYSTIRRVGSLAPATVCDATAWKASMSWSTVVVVKV